MTDLYNKLFEDVRFREGLKACLNCSTYTAICPAAEFYDYQPRRILDILIGILYDPEIKFKEANGHDLGKPESPSFLKFYPEKV